MVEPGTAAILVLSAITGIGGYGASKMNSKPGALISREAYEDAIAKVKELEKSAKKFQVDTIQLIKNLKEEKNALEESKKKLESQKEVLESEKDTLSKNLQSATDLEKTYRAVSPEVFKQAIEDFMKEKAIVDLGHPEIFEPLLSRYSVSRGTAQSLYTKLENTVVQPISKTEFDTLLLKSLKNADRSLEQNRLKEAEDAKAKKEEEAAKATAAKTKKEEDAKAAKKIKDDTATAAAEAAKAAKKIKDDAAKAAKDAKEAKTLQEIVNEALEAAKKGPLTSNTLYQSIKTPFLSGVDSVARGVQKVGEVTKQVVTKTGEVLRTPLTRYEQRQERFKKALEQQGGAGDTFDTDVYYRLFHPKDEDRPNKTLADLFKRTSDDTLAKNMLPIFDAFMYWRKTVLNSPILYKPELVAAATNLFKTIVPSEVNRVFQNKELNKLLDASNIRISPNPMVTTPTTGGMRKKKLRTRRGVKQNVRRTRRSQNRPNRSN